MPNGKDKDWLKKEIARLLSLAKIGIPSRNKELIDRALEHLIELGEDNVRKKPIKKNDRRGT
jgi:type II secretory pathway predicted ATPase ExeA